MAPFQPFAEALGRYFQSLSADRISRMPDWQLTELSRLVLRLREYAPIAEEEGGDPERERFRFFEAVVATLNELSSRGPVLLVIDDLHAADQPTLLLLRHVLRGVDDAKLGVVGMFIDTEVPADHRLRAMLADFRAVHPVATVHLQGLSSAGVEELVQGWPNAPADLVPQLCRLTDGNPLFLDELLRQLGYREAEQSEEGDAPVPPNLSPTEAIRELVARRVSRLPEDVIYLLQAAAVAGPECEAGVVAEAAELTPGASSSMPSTGPRNHACSAASARRSATATPSPTRSYATPSTASSCAGGGCATTTRSPSPRSGCTPTSWTPTSTSWPTTSTWVRPWPTRTRPVHYCRAAGERALRLLAFEEAAVHFARSLEVAEQFGPSDPEARCDALIALAEAQNRAGDTALANTNFERAATLARSLRDADRLAAAALRAGPLSYLGIVRANEEQIRLLEEALAALPEGKDSHLRAMVTARLGLVIVYGTDVAAAGDPAHARSPSATTRSPWPGVSGTASRSGTRSTRACTRCGASGPRPSGWRRGRSSARSPTTSATSCWPCTGTCGVSVSCWPRATSTP